MQPRFSNERSFHGNGEREKKKKIEYIDHFTHLGGESVIINAMLRSMIVIHPIVYVDLLELIVIS